MKSEAEHEGDTFMTQCDRLRSMEEKSSKHKLNKHEGTEDVKEEKRMTQEDIASMSRETESTKHHKVVKKVITLGTSKVTEAKDGIQKQCPGNLCKRGHRKNDFGAC